MRQKLLTEDGIVQAREQPSLERRARLDHISRSGCLDHADSGATERSADEEHSDILSEGDEGGADEEHAGA